MHNFIQQKNKYHFQGYIYRIIRWPELKMLTGLGRTTIWRREKLGKFPRKIDLGGGLVGWRSDEVQKWLKDPAGYKTATED